jgi:hypothetical protein
MEPVMLRQDLVEADLTCLMCGRLIGQLAGLVLRDVREARTMPSTLRWRSFRAASADKPPALLTGRERFCCDQCGGAAVLEAITVNVVRDSVTAEDACPIHRDRIQRRGRRPRGCLCNAVDSAA